MGEEYNSSMVKVPKHEDEIQEEMKTGGDMQGSSSHPTKDSTERDKAAKFPGAFGNEWDSKAAGGE
jgi:hypothetical protein